MIYLLSVRFTNCLHSRVHPFCPLSDQAFAVVLRKQQYLRMKMVKGVFAEEARLELVIQKGESSDKEAEVRGWLPAAGLTFLICPYLCVCVCVCVCVCAQLFSCAPTNCNPPGSSVHGIFKARILEWVVISSLRVSSQSRDQIFISHISCTSCIGRQILYH